MHNSVRNIFLMREMAVLSATVATSHIQPFRF